MKLDSYTLDNGLKIYLVNDFTKHTTYINLIVKFGGLNNKIKINNKKIKIKNGTAHFLEHLVLEQTEYGDLMNIFGESGVGSNGFTSIDRTQFYIDTVTDVEENLKLLIKGIHSPIITNENVSKIKKPILEEKRRSLDNKYSNLYNSTIKSLANNKDFTSILGDLKEISAINTNDLKMVFKSFYRPDNEVIVIGGRFDKDKILKTIEETYNELVFDTNNIEKILPKNDHKISKKRIITKEDINIERTVISFKLDIKNMAGYDKLMLDLYLYFFLKMNFGIMSKLNENLIKENIILGNVSFSSNILMDYQTVRIEANTRDENKFIETILDYILNSKYIFDEHLFDLYKKNYIIDLIIRNDNIYKKIDPLIDNILLFDYEGLDSIEDVESLTFNDFKKSIKNLDFTKYSIGHLKRK